MNILSASPVRASVIVVIGVFLLFAGLAGANWMASSWLSSKATSDWWMNAYISVAAKDAFVFFGVIPLVVGGVLFGVLLPLLLKLSCSCRCGSITGLFASVIGASGGSVLSTALGFNTLDWMLTYTTSASNGVQNMWTMWNLLLPFVKINSWNFYLCDVLLPLWFGGFLITFPIVHTALFWGK